MSKKLYDLCQVVEDKQTVTQSVINVKDLGGLVKKIYPQVGILYKDEDDLNDRLAHLLLTGEAVDYKPKGAVNVDSPKPSPDSYFESLQSEIGNHTGFNIALLGDKKYQFKEFCLIGNTHNIELHEFLKLSLKDLNEINALKDSLNISNNPNMGIWMGHFEINPRNIIYILK